MSPFDAYGNGGSSTRFRQSQAFSGERRRKLMIGEEKKYKKTTERYYNNYKNRPNQNFQSSLYKSLDTNNSTERTKTAKTTQISPAKPITERKPISSTPRRDLLKSTQKKS